MCWPPNSIATKLLFKMFKYIISSICSLFPHCSCLFATLPWQDYGRVPLGYEDLFRRKQEQWAHHHHHHHHSANRPSQSSPIFTIEFGTEVERDNIRYVHAERQSLIKSVYRRDS